MDTTHTNTSLMARALGKDFTGTALFAASVAELSIECSRRPSSSGRILPIFSSFEVSIRLKTLEAPPPQNYS